MEISEDNNNFLDTVAHKKAFKPKSKKVVVEKGVQSEKESTSAKAKNKGASFGKRLKGVFTRERFKFIEHSKKKPFTLHGVIVIWLLIPIFLFGTLSYLYEYHNKDKIYNGVRVFGVDAGGKTKEELSKALDGKVLGYKLNIEGENQKFEASLADLGISYNKQKIVDDAYSYGRDDSVLNNFFNRAKRFFSRYEINIGSKKFAFKKHDVSPVYNTDDIKLDKYLADVESKINVNPKDSEVTTSGASVQAVPAVFGRKMKTADLKSEILALTSKFENKPLKIRTDTLTPKILDEKTKVLAEQADKLASKSVVFSYKDKKYQPTKDVVVSWITFTRVNEQSDWQMVIDQSKMYAYFKVIGREINIYPVDRKIRVENGTKEVVVQEGSNGTVINESMFASQIAPKLQNDPQISIEIPMMTAAFRVQKENVVVANWDKYIDVNLSAQTLVAYEKGGVAKGNWRVATGKRGFETPVGTWLVVGKSSWIRMKGMQGTSEAYDLYPIKWATWFKGGGYAMHDAYWRHGSFGTPGSHGCINMPDAGASFIYGWADMGTPVIVHY